MARREYSEEFRKDDGSYGWLLPKQRSWGKT